MCGTVFLWCFWPSFNSAPGGADDTGRYFAVVNTYLALCAAVMATYATSIWVTPGRKITMEHVQNATLAGGVAMGSAASMPVQPFAALLIGAIAGIVSVLGYSFVKVSLFQGSLNTQASIDQCVTPIKIILACITQSNQPS